MFFFIKRHEVRRRYGDTNKARGEASWAVLLSIYHHGPFLMISLLQHAHCTAQPLLPVTSTPSVPHPSTGLCASYKLHLTSPSLHSGLYGWAPGLQCSTDGSSGGGATAVSDPPSQVPSPKSQVPTPDSQETRLRRFDTRRDGWACPKSSLKFWWLVQRSNWSSWSRLQNSKVSKR